MNQDLDEKLVEILNILLESKEPTGAKIIANELKNRGYNIGERAVRYHLQILDEKNLTKKLGYSGRMITEKGIEELEKANISYRMGSIFSQIMENLYLSNFPVKIIVNTATFEGDYKTIKNLILKSFENGFSVGDYLNIQNKGGLVEVETLCSITFDNFLLKNGIIPLPRYGGIVKFEDYEPVHFEGAIDYRDSSIDPLVAFITQDKTDVLGIIENGEGYLPANFRVIPSSTKEKFENLLKKDLLNCVLAYGEENVLGLNINEEEIGVALVGGLTPLCIPIEKGYKMEINAATKLKNLVSMERRNKKYLEPVCKKGKRAVKPVLSKMLSLMERVTYDIEEKKGDIIVNTGCVDKKYKKEVFDALRESYEKKLTISDRVGIETKDGQIFIHTLCSLTIDGIILKNEIPVIPCYGGVLELRSGKGNRFIDVIAYRGTSLDPHEVFFNKTDGEKNILAGIREAPMSAKDHIAQLNEKLEWNGIIEIGRPNNDISGVRVEKGMIGFTTVGGINPLVLIKKRGVPIEINALHKTMNYSDLIHFEEL
jgi:hypothetical protein